MGWMAHLDHAPRTPTNHAKGGEGLVTTKCTPRDFVCFMCFVVPNSRFGIDEVVHLPFVVLREQGGAQDWRKRSAMNHKQPGPAKAGTTNARAGPGHISFQETMV